jgi:hypothetical protein
MNKISALACMLLLTQACNSNLAAPPLVKVKDVFTNKAVNTIYVVTTDNKQLVLDKDEELSFDIQHMTDDKQWIIVEQLPADPGPSRVETISLLYNTCLMKKVTNDKVGPHRNTYFDFVKQNGEDYVEALDNTTHKTRLISLKKIYKAIIQ